MKQTVRTVLAAVGLVAGSALMTAPSAQAANGCSGVLQGSRTLTERATLDIYLENGTTNCVALRTRGKYYGKASWMGVGIGGKNSVSECAYPQTLNVNQVVCGNYHSWVGGAHIYAPHSCISMWAMVEFNGVTYSANWFNQFCE